MWVSGWVGVELRGEYNSRVKHAGEGGDGEYANILGRKARTSTVFLRCSLGASGCI